MLRQDTIDFIEDKLNKPTDDIPFTAVVTGGTGFIGGHIAVSMLRFFDKVLVIDMKSFDENYLNYLIKKYDAEDYRNRLKVKIGSVMDLSQLIYAFKGVSVVVHTAAMLGVENVTRNPYDVVVTNTIGTYNVLEAINCSRLKNGRVLLTSSSEVYGRPDKLPLVEDVPTAPVSNYGISKLAAEKLVLSSRHFDPVVVRYFNVYGNNQREDFVVPIFIKNVIEGVDPTIFGNGLQSRCYTHIDDAVDGTLRALFAGDAEVYNIGNDEIVSVKRLAEYIISLGADYLQRDALIRRVLRPVYRNYGDNRYHSTEPLKRQPDTTKARTTFGFDPRVSWEDGIRSLYMSMKVNIEQPASREN